MSERAVPNCVLVVEDGTEVRAALEELLRVEGFETIGARNGREALAALEEGPLPVLILLDLMMPVMGGWEFRLEQRRRPRLAGLPVVVTGRPQALS